MFLISGIELIASSEIEVGDIIIVEKVITYWTFVSSNRYLGSNKVIQHIAEALIIIFLSKLEVLMYSAF